MCALYGAECLKFSGEEENYELFVGLWANRERATIRKGLSVSIGLGLVLGGGTTTVYEALSETKSEASIIANKYKSAASERSQIMDRVNAIKTGK